MKKLSRGFTLIELLVVIGILAILLAITLIAINPARQFGQANDTRRRSDVLQILNAVHQYVAENQGQLPAEITGLTVGTPEVLNDTNFPLLCGLLSPDYIPALPTDPGLNIPNITVCTGAWGNTDYSIGRDAANRITVSATGDITTSITVTR